MEGIFGLPFFHVIFFSTFPVLFLSVHFYIFILLKILLLDHRWNQDNFKNQFYKYKNRENIIRYLSSCVLDPPMHRAARACWSMPSAFSRVCFCTVPPRERMECHIIEVQQLPVGSVVVESNNETRNILRWEEPKLAREKRKTSV